MMTIERHAASCVQCKGPMWRYRSKTNTWWINDPRPHDEWYQINEERLGCDECRVLIETTEEQMQIWRQYVMKNRPPLDYNALMGGTRDQ